LPPLLARLAGVDRFDGVGESPSARPGGVESGQRFDGARVSTLARRTVRQPHGGG